MPPGKQGKFGGARRGWRSRWILPLSPVALIQVSSGRAILF